MTSRLSALAALVLLLASCGTNTMPTAEDMDRYYRKAEQMAADQTAILKEQRNRGEISQEEYDVKTAAIQGRITRQASELAWARHEISEARKRSLGIPTGDSAVQVQVPGIEGRGTGESFYRRAGTTGPGSLINNNTPFGGPTLGGLGRGVTPGTSGGSLSGY